MGKTKYIDAEPVIVALRIMEKEHKENAHGDPFEAAFAGTIAGIANAIDKLPAADVVERPKEADYTVENALKQKAERRGRWVDSKRMGFDGTFHWFRQCSECLYEREDDTPEKDTNYCPNCGSRMDLGEEK